MSILDGMSQPTPSPLNLIVIEIVRKTFSFPLPLWFAFRSHKRLFVLTVFPSGMELMELWVTVVICSLTNSGFFQAISRVFLDSGRGLG